MRLKGYTVTDYSRSYVHVHIGHNKEKMFSDIINEYMYCTVCVTRHSLCDRNDLYIYVQYM